MISIDIVRNRLLSVKWIHNIILRVEFRKQFHLFKKRSGDNIRFLNNWNDRYPCLYDKNRITEFDKHYIYHTAWAARILRKYSPEFHIDISSSINFCTLVSAFIPIFFFDYRPLKINLENLDCSALDLLHLPFKSKSINSLSCMHVIEHIGLGRYGDPLNPKGDLLAISEISRVLAPKGNLIIVVPIGKTPKILFNAHRIYSYSQILEYFPNFNLIEFAIVMDNPSFSDFIKNANPVLTNYCDYGCGCFWFQKKIE